VPPGKPKQRLGQIPHCNSHCAALFCTSKPNQTAVQLIHNYRIRLIGISIVTALRFAFMNSDMLAGLQPATWQQLAQDLVLTFVMSAIGWEANRLVVLFVNRKYLLEAAWKRKFLIEFFYVLGVNAAMYGVILLINYFMAPTDKPPLLFLWLGYFFAVLLGLLVVALYELLYFIDAWQRATKETEQLKRLNVTIQLESLKNQVKPHFLFNSLNTLTGLVEKDPTRAVRFIAELSKVYRYLLQSNEKEVIALQQELQFTQAYYYLLQTRFGNGISMEVDVDSRLQQYLIPPLTLQMLLENAVKHNQVSVRKPLQVRIWAEEDQWLLVQNNIQHKRQVTASTGTGLTNIASKFHLLNQPKMMVHTDDQFFTIKVPLIKAPVL
jgi:hypothetical protein